MNTTEAAKLTQWLNPPQPTRPLARYRLTLRDGETYTRSASTREVPVLSGIACSWCLKRRFYERMAAREQLIGVEGRNDSQEQYQISWTIACKEYLHAQIAAQKSARFHPRVGRVRYGCKHIILIHRWLAWSFPRRLAYSSRTGEADRSTEPVVAID